MSQLRLSPHKFTLLLSSRLLTISGSQSPSAIPNNLSLAVPATTTSFAKLRHPMRSAPAMKGSSLLLIPAMTGSTK